MNGRVTIVGQGLAGTCVAWHLWWRDVPFLLLDRGHGGSSRVAAGLVNPLSGKRFTRVWRFAEFCGEAEHFHHRVAATLGHNHWHPAPILRLTADDDEWRRMLERRAEPELAAWMAGEAAAPPGWRGALVLRGGGWLDTRGFLDASRDFFRARGCWETTAAGNLPPDATVVRCEGASGLLENFSGLHRCAKGEILTLAPRGGWRPETILIGGRGWLVPSAGGLCKAGATHEWQTLDEQPTAEGRAEVEEIARRLAPGAFEVVAHEAGVRPILRRSQPLIGRTGPREWTFNGLGSKGSLYAPGVAKRLADAIVDDLPLDPELDLACWDGRNP